MEALDRWRRLGHAECTAERHEFERGERRIDCGGFRWRRGHSGVHHFVRGLGAGARIGVGR